MVGDAGMKAGTAVLPDPSTWSGAIPFSTQLMTALKSAPACGHGPRLLWFRMPRPQ